MKVMVSLPEDLVTQLDQLADEVDTDRSDVIEGLLGFALEHVDEVYPEEESDEEESNEEESDEEE